MTVVVALFGQVMQEITGAFPTASWTGSSDDALVTHVATSGPVLTGLAMARRRRLGGGSVLRSFLASAFKLVPRS